MIHSIVIIHPIKFHIDPSFPYRFLISPLVLRVSFRFFITRSLQKKKHPSNSLSLGPIKGSIKIRVTEISLGTNGIPSVIYRIHVNKTAKSGVKNGGPEKWSGTDASLFSHRSLKSASTGAASCRRGKVNGGWIEVYGERGKGETMG